MREDIDKEADVDPDRMPFRVVFDESRDCLEAQIEGWIENADHLIVLFMQVASTLRRCGASKVLLIDHTRGVVPDEAGMKRLMQAVAGQGFDHVRLAYVDARGTAISRMEVGEILGREYGYECRVFDSVQRARIWLNYGEG